MTDASSLTGGVSAVPAQRSARSGPPRVGPGFVVLYTLAFLSTSLLFLAPLLVTLALKVNSLVGTERAPNSLSLVAGVGGLLSIVANPFFGRMSDRTSGRWGRRRPWMVIGLLGGSAGILAIALAPGIAVVLVGWCIAQVFFNALLAAEVAVLPDQVPEAQRGTVAGVLGICTPVASVTGTFLVKLFTGNLLLMFLAPCVIGGFFILLFAVVLSDRPLAAADKPPWSLKEFASTFYVDPRRSPDFAWAFASRFLLVLAYAFLATYQAYYLLNKLGSAEADVPQQIFLGALVQSVLVVLASLVGGRLSDWTGRRKVFVLVGVDRVRLRALRARRRHRRQRLPRRHGHQRARLRGVLRRRPRARDAGAPGQGQRRQGSGRVQHRRGASLHHRAGARPGHPGRRRRELQRAVRRRRALRRDRGFHHPAGQAGPMSGPTAVVVFGQASRRRSSTAATTSSDGDPRQHHGVTRSTGRARVRWWRLGPARCWPGWRAAGARRCPAGTG